MSIAINGTNSSVGGVLTTEIVKTTDKLFAANPFINGAMQIDQANDGAAVTITNAGSPAYGCDMFLGTCVGANTTMQQVTRADNIKAQRMNGAASLTSLQLHHRIESKNAARFASVPSLISFELSNSVLTSMTWQLYSANAVDVYSALTLIDSGTITVSPTATRFDIPVTPSAAAANGLQLTIVATNQTSGYFEATKFDMVEGTVGRPYPHQELSIVRAQCQTRLKKIYGETYIFSGRIESTTTADIYVPASFAKKPLVTFNNVSISDGIIGAPVTSAVGVWACSDGAVFIRFAASGGGLSNNKPALLYFNSSAAYIMFDARL